MQPYVLMIGYRQHLAAALYARRISYSIWAEKALKAAPPGADQVICAPFTSDSNVLTTLLGGKSFASSPTHVIAGGETAVFPAAAVRRFFGIEGHPSVLLRRCTDKATMKEYLTQHAVPMTKFIPHRAGLTAEYLAYELNLPVVIKNSQGSGGKNMIFAHTIAEIEAGMGPGQLYETFVDAPEGSIESFVADGKVVFTNLTEYFVKKVSNIVPASFSAAECEQIYQLNQQVIEALSIKTGLIHLEFYRSKKGILFGELALRPPGGYIMELLRRAYGFNPWDLFIDVELGLEPRLPVVPAKRTAACIVLHPGPGRVVHAEKPSKVSYPTLVKSLLKVKVGDVISARFGVSDDVGYCLFCDESRQKVIDDVQCMLGQTPVQV